MRVYDVQERKCIADIENAAQNFGRFSAARFGQNPDEVLIFSDFGVKLTIWSLITCRGVEIKDPKYAVRCHSYRPKTGHMAVLTRSATFDILLLLSPRNYEIIRSVEVPAVDAQEVVWSPDGAWLAIRDTASCGYRILIYTPDGHLYKICTKDASVPDITRGSKCLQWSPSTRFLAIGDNDNEVMILSKKTFYPIATFRHAAIFPHGATISLPKVTIWQEQLNNVRERSYGIASQPVCPPISSPASMGREPQYGVSIVAFNSEETLLVTRDDSIPTTIWVWCLKIGTAVAVLVHHSPVKNLLWHPKTPDLLLIHCAIPEPALHLWKSTWDAPRIVNIPLENTGGRLEASWLQSSVDGTFNVMLSSAHQYATTQITNYGEMMVPKSSNPEKEPELPGTGPEDLFDEGDSLDFSPIKWDTVELPGEYNLGPQASGSSFDLDDETVDDTFDYRRQVRGAH